MSWSTKGYNAICDGVRTVVTRVSLHTSDPSTTGANEVVGGSYARQTITWNAAASGQATNNGAISFTGLPASTTVQFLGFWDITGPNFYGYVPVGGFAPFPVVADATDLITAESGHGLVNGDQVVVMDVLGAGVPTGLTEGTVYFVVSQTSTTFKLSTTSGGAAVDITSDGRMVVQKILPETFSAAGGTATISDATTLLDARFV